MRTGLILLATALTLLVGALGLGKVLLGESPGGAFELRPRPAPPPGCPLAVEVDRTSNLGTEVQFGELRCMTPFQPALRVGEGWFNLPDRELGSRYNIVRRTPDDLHWLVVGNSDIFRSDDGGRTFKQLKTPGWVAGAKVDTSVVTGEALEQIVLNTDSPLTTWERLTELTTDDVPWRERPALWKQALLPPATGYYVPTRQDTSVSNDGGRTWTRTRHGTTGWSPVEISTGVKHWIY
jgi:hypothetical protein